MSRDDIDCRDFPSDIHCSVAISAPQGEAAGGYHPAWHEEEKWINPGDSVVVAPGGEIVAGPMSMEKGILFFDIDLKQAARAKRALDVTGHYSRSDIFTLHVDTTPQSPTSFD